MKKKRCLQGTMAKCGKNYQFMSRFVRDIFGQKLMQTPRLMIALLKTKMKKGQFLGCENERGSLEFNDLLTNTLFGDNFVYGG